MRRRFGKGVVVALLASAATAGLTTAPANAAGTRSLADCEGHGRTYDEGDRGLA